jgi:4-amino-4-deoxy-L-arabinose transferase-like glycosyltransferase
VALPRRLFLLVAGLTLARAVLAAAAPVTVDEAYYVQWALHPALGYLDHPPLVAWLTAAGLTLGRSALAVRLPALVLQAVTTLLAADLARALAAARPGGRDPARAGERGAWAAALLLQAAPVFSLGGMLSTPDAPLALAWVGTLWALERALSRDRRWLLAAGLFLGVAGLSKLTAGPLGLAVLAALASTGAGRALLRTPWPWLGAAVAAAVAAPFLAWNATHGWASLAFQAGHGLSGGTFSAARLAASAGGQAAYVSPVLLVACLAPALAALRGPDPARRAVAASALPVVAFFTAAAAFTPGALPHWPAPGWLSAVVLLAVAGSRLTRPAVVSGAGLQLLALLLALAPVSLAHDPRDEVRGWREGAAAAEVAAAGRTLAATHWIALGQLGWFARTPVVYVGDRPCAASLYAPDPRGEGRPLLVVSVDGLGPDRAALERRMGAVEPAGSYAAREGGRVVRVYRFWRWGRGSAAAAAAP